MFENNRLYVVTYEGRPFCVCSSPDEAAALKMAEAFMGYTADPEDAAPGRGVPEIAPPPPEESAKLAVREPTAEERRQFERRNLQISGEVVFAGMTLNGGKSGLT